MTKQDDDSEEPIEVSSIKLNLLKKADLILMVNGLIDDNNVLNGQVDELEKENSDLLCETKALSKKLHTKEVAPIATFCTNCKGKNIKATSDNMLNSKLDLILDKLDTLTKSIDDKTVNQTVFVKARPGLGYEDGPNTVTSASDKLAKELTEKIDNLDKALQTSKSNNKYLKDKITVLEKGPQNNKKWFHGEPAHNMYVKQAKAESQNVKLQKKRTYYPGRGKYGWSGYFKVCTYCGDNGHKHYECAAKQYYKPRASRQYNFNANSSQARPNHAYKYQARQPNAVKVLNPNVFSC